MSSPPAPVLAFDPALNMARQALYRFAAITLLDPKAGSWPELQALGKNGLVAEAAALVRSQKDAHSQPLGPGERPLADLDPVPVLALLPEDPQQSNHTYERTFGLLVSSACPPYETEYINGKFTFQRSHGLADISGFYRAFGLQPSQVHPERHDHIVLELEFMAFLLGLERRAAESERAERAEQMAVCQRAQQRFLQEHLAWWAPAFAKLMAKEAPGGFYEAVGIFLAALIGAERGLLAVPLADPRAAPAPSALERPEECEGCMLAGS